MQPTSHEPGHHSVLDVQPAQPPQNPGQPSPQDLPTLPQQMMPLTVKPKKHVPVVAIVVAVMVCALIIGVVAVVFIQSKRTKTANTPIDQGTTQQTSNGRLSGQDVTSVKQELTKNINTMDDSKDFTSDDLSNQTLGL